MKRMAFACAVVVMLAGGTGARAQEPPKPADPGKEHEWLQRFVGEWEGDFANSAESARMVGGLWMVADFKATVSGKPMAAIMTLGYDPQKKKYVGTWIDTMTAYLWNYEGAVDAAGKVLTLDAEGPNPLAPGKTAKMRDAIEFKSNDHKVLTSSMLGDDGKWVTFMTINYKRRK